MFQLTDQQVLLFLFEYAEKDQKAMKLMIELQDNKDFGQRDMVLSQIHRYVQDRMDSD